jgi:Protein of unknown function (DUF732)
VTEAWSEEPTDEIVQDYPEERGGRGVVAVAVLAVVAAAIAAVTAVVVLVSPRPNVIAIQPVPVEQAPAKTGAPPNAVAAPPPPPLVIGPPAQQEIPPPGAQPQSPPDAHQVFVQALRGDTRQTQNGAGLYPSDPNVDSEAQEMCQDLANGGSVQPYIDGTLRKSPTLAPWQASLAVHQAIRAYCPQYDR